MLRRDFLRAAVSAAALSGLPGAAAAAARDSWAAAFREALAAKPWLLGWMGRGEDRLETASLEVSGAWPDGLRGTFYRNGPFRHEVGGMRYRHWFDGDGMVHAFRIGGGRVSHLGRLVETAKVAAERAAGRALRQTFGTALPGMEPAANPDSINAANVSVLWHDERLFALWEGGSAYRLDPETLETGGPHAWSPETRGLPFSAHPHRDLDGTLWNIGCAPGFGVLVVYRIGADGRLREAVPLRIGNTPMVHDFTITRSHLVVILPPLFLDPGAGGSLLDSLVWRPERPARVLVIDKAALSRPRILEMPAHFTFHYGNAWEDSAGVVRLDAARYDDPSVMFEMLRAVMRGELKPGRPARHHLVRIDPAKGAVSETPLTEAGRSVEFPHVDRRRTGRRYRKVTLLMDMPGAESRHPMPNAVGRLDVETGALAGYAYPPTTMPEEHVFVPRPGGDSEDDGWLLGTGLDFAAGATRLNVFDAARPEDGPVASARLPYALPLGLHGIFVPS